jgi:polyisoprenoid-binding protein YceI
MRILQLSSSVAALAIALSASPLAQRMVSASDGAIAPPALRVQATPPPETPRPSAPGLPAGLKLSFDFKDPKGVNAVGFIVDSTLEPIFGTGTGISGSVEFDATDPMGATGVLRMEAKAVRTTNDRMTEVLHGPDWLDVATHPAIEIRLLKVESVEPRSLNEFKIQARAEVVIKGTSREMSLPLLATYLPGRLGDRLRGATGDLLVLRSRFSVKRSEFALNVASSPEVVAEEIVITAAIVGSRKTG